MDDDSRIIADLLIVLASGFLAGTVCKRLGVSLLVGYLVVGALIGEGVLGFVSQESHELEYLARGGALLLLFSVGIEFSLEELVRLSRYFLLGGIVQMILVAIPLTAVCLACGMNWNAAILIGAAGALSSTILVFKALAECGQSATSVGRRAIGILLFQDVALVPLMLLIPLLTNQGEPPSVTAFAILAGKSLVFVASVLVLRHLVGRWIVPELATLRSVELVVLFALCTLGSVCWAASELGLPPAVGALAAGIMLSSNRLSSQVDTIVLPFRESFAAVFFVTLGTLLNPSLILEEPVLLTSSLVGMVLLKSIAAAVALKAIGLNWKASIGMGLGLAQLGEFSFLLLAEGVSQGVISAVDYNRMLFISLGTLILTPQLLKFGLKWTEDEPDGELGRPWLRIPLSQHAIVVGAGPIGQNVASRLETMGIVACLVDTSPVNLHAFAQNGFPTVAGDARNSDVLVRADAAHCRLAVVCIPDEKAANQVVKLLRSLNAKASILVRCRYQNSINRAEKAGANAVISEEVEASLAFLRWCEQSIKPTPDAVEPETDNDEENQ